MEAIRSSGNLLPYRFNKMKQEKIIFSTFIIILGITFRIFLNEKIGIPNFEAITALSLLSGSFLGGIYGALIPLLIMFFSDIYFGNNLVYRFTWSAFIIIGILGNIVKGSSKYYYLKITGLGVFSVLFFYLWTNFGWWMISGMYPMNFQGLTQCYIAGLPFLKNQLSSALIFTPILASVFFWVLNLIKRSQVKSKLKLSLT